MAVEFKGRWFPKDLILRCIRWYLAYKLSYRDLEEMMTERGVSVDHSTIQRWVVKYLNNILEQDHRGVKRRTGTMLGFKSFHSARKTLAGIDLVHMLRKNQHENSSKMSPAELFYSLAG